jgi:hypothetical protein
MHFSRSASALHLGEAAPAVRAAEATANAAKSATTKLFMAAPSSAECAEGTLGETSGRLDDPDH